MPHPPILLLDGCRVDLDTGVVSSDEHEQKLTRTERRLLIYLVRNAQRTVPRDELLREVWRYQERVVSRTADVTLRRLRAKVESDPSRPSHLLTIHGVGYRFVPARRPPALPPERTPMVGRAVELTRLEAGIESPGVMVLLGPGGMGKTRLALRAAHRWSASVWFCDLSSIRDEQGLTASLGSALGVHLIGADGMAQLVRVLEENERPLLILDNAEHLLEVVRPVVAFLRERVPKLTQLITSRATLKVPDERRLYLGPLDPEASLTLFTQRTLLQTSQPIPAQQSDAARQLVVALEGLPLAIELAAARSAVLSPDIALERLGLDLLQRGDGDGGRHGSLRAVLGWSWALLTPEDRELLEGAAVFQGGFDLAAAEAVLTPKGDVLLSLQRLWELSLLVVEGDATGRRRYRLLDTTRSYASERLDASGRRAAIEAKHTQWYDSLGAALVSSFRLRGRGADLDALQEERENLRSARERAEPERAVALSIVLDELFTKTGPMALRRSNLEAAWAAAERSGVDALKVRILVRQASATQDMDEMRQRCEAAEALAPREPQAVAALAQVQAALLSRSGSLEAAVKAVVSAVPLAENAGRDDLHRKLLFTQAWSLKHLGKTQESLRVMAGLSAQCRMTGHVRADALYSVHMLAVMESELSVEELNRELDRVLTLQSKLDSRLLSNNHLSSLGGLLLEANRVALARTHLERSLLQAHRIGDLLQEGVSLLNLGNVEWLEGEFGAARRCFLEARALFEALNLHHYEAYAWLNLGALSLDPETIERALDLSGGESQMVRLLYTVWYPSALAARGRLEEAEAAWSETEALTLKPESVVWQARTVLHGLLFLARGELEAARGCCIQEGETKRIWLEARLADQSLRAALARAALTS